MGEAEDLRLKVAGPGCSFSEAEEAMAAGGDVHLRDEGRGGGGWLVYLAAWLQGSSSAPFRSAAR
jgi:hypothetical protein